MSRRIPSLAAQIAPFMRSYYAGRVDWASLGYKFCDKGYTNPQGVHFAATEDDSGRAVSLCSRRTTLNCPQPPGDYPAIKGRGKVPLSVCQKCAHRLPKGCCALLRQAAITGHKEAGQ